MAVSLNKITLIGNLGQDPEIKQKNDGTNMAKFSLATSESWKGQDGQTNERTEWHKIVVHQPGLVDLIDKYVQKGQRIYLEGKLVTRKWQNNEGKDQWSTEIVMSSVIFLGGGRQSNSSNNYSNNNYSNKQNNKPKQSYDNAESYFDDSKGSIDEEVPF